MRLAASGLLLIKQPAHEEDPFPSLLLLSRLLLLLLRLPMLFLMLFATLVLPWSLLPLFLFFFLPVHLPMHLDPSHHLIPEQQADRCVIAELWGHVDHPSVRAEKEKSLPCQV